MKTLIIISARVLLFLTIITGVIYPLAITGIAQICFPYEANGSLLPNNHGSALLTPAYTDSTLFLPRPSAGNYSTVASSASNLGTLSAALATTVQERKEFFLRIHNLSHSTVVPEEMLYASASGLDPHISLLSAQLQATRVATMRSLSTTQVLELIRKNTVQPQLGFLGEPCVNVVVLNNDITSIR